MAREEELVQKAKEVRESLIQMAKDEINATHIEVGEITAKDDVRSLLTIMVGGANRLVPYQGHDTSEFTVGEFWTVVFFDDYGTIKLGWWVAAAGGGGTIPFRPHDLLNGTAHPDTVAQAVTRGSVIVGDSTPEWNELVIGPAARYLRSDGADPAWAQPPGSEITNTPAGTIAATDVQAAINELDTEKAPTHNLLDGTWHPDTVAQAATRGSVIVGDSTPEWNELAIGAAARYLRSDGADPAWAQIPGSEVVNTPAGTIAATDVQAAINELDTEKAPTHDLLDGTWHPDTVAQAVTRGSIIYGDSTPEWNELPIGAAGRVLTSDGTDVSWAVNPGGNHNLLDGTVHPDTVAQAVTRGSIIYGDATPKWNELVIGVATRYLRSDGTDAAWAAIPGSEVVNTPAGTIAATDVQAALNELDTEKRAIADGLVFVRADRDSDLDYDALTSANWEGIAYSSGGGTIDWNAVFGVPNAAKAVFVQCQVRDSAAAWSHGIRLKAKITTTNYSIEAYCIPHNDEVHQTLGILPIAADGTSYYLLAASGVLTLDVWIRVIGWYV